MKHNSEIILKVLYLIRKYPVASFFFLCLFLYFFIKGIILGFEVSHPVICTFLDLISAASPTISAIIVIFIKEGSSKIAELFKGVIRGHKRKRGCIIALSPIIVAFISVGIYYIFCNTLYSGRTHSLASFVERLISGFILVPLEEFGWRGFALPRLQKHKTAIKAGLIVGIFWVLWHIPNWFDPRWGLDWLGLVPFSIVGVSISVIMTWLFNKTGGSLFIIMLMHYVYNLSDYLVTNQLALIPAKEYYCISAILYSIFAILVWRVYMRNSTYN